MQKIEKVKQIVKKESNILFGYIFGSYAKGSFNSNSDIDIALYFKDNSFDYYLEIVHKIEKNIKTDVDLVVLNSAKNLYLLDDILKNSIVIKDHPKRFDFEVYKWHEIVDFKELNKRLESA